MYEVAYQVRFWLDEILLIAALIVAVSSPRAPAKPWLVAMIAVSIAVGFGWYAWSLAQRAGSPLGDDTLRIVTMLAMNAVSLAVPASTVAFVVAWRSKSGSSVYGTTSSPDAGV
jgi:hypothetical protein